MKQLVASPWSPWEYIADKGVKDIYLDRKAAGTHFRGIYLRGARIVGDLTQFELREAWLEEVVFANANLREADLRCAHMKGCSFNVVALVEVDASGADFSGCSFTNVDFSLGRFDQAKFQAVEIKDAVGLPSWLGPEEQPHGFES